jgi:hypothetical protein
MNIVAIVCFSGYGHTAKQAEAVAAGIRSTGSIAEVYRLPDQGDLPEGLTLEDIGQANAIIYGSPIHMGGPAWQFKKFADACSKLFELQAWKKSSQQDLPTPPLSAATNLQRLPISGHWQCRWGRSGWAQDYCRRARKAARQPISIGLQVLAELMQSRLQTLRSTKLRALAIWRPQSCWGDALPN